MIKFTEAEIVFSEIPDEVTLAINISNCQNNCFNCHSSYLRQNIGEELTTEALDNLIERNGGITCVCFMGEGKDSLALQNLISHLRQSHANLKIGLYSGREEVLEDFYWNTLDYLKIGPYMPEFGPINEDTTNQRLYSRCEGIVTGVPSPITGETRYRYPWKDITEKFWKNGNGGI